MLDMGFLPDIRKILRLLPAKRQSLMFSATMPPEILSLAHEFLNHPEMVQVGQRSSAAVGIRHAVYPVPRHLKMDLLVELLRGENLASVLIFARTKRFADRLTQDLDRRGIRVSVLHGDRSQGQRLHALEQFRRGRSRVMVATDIAARGIDIDEITHVINYDVPDNPDSYIHRIGRTARAELSGDAFTLVDKEEEPYVRAIEQALHKTLPRVTLPNFDYKRGGGGSGGFRRGHQSHQQHSRHRGRR